jgi:hypothetical protein
VKYAEQFAGKASAGPDEYDELINENPWRVRFLQCESALRDTVDKNEKAEKKLTDDLEALKEEKNKMKASNEQKDNEIAALHAIATASCKEVKQVRQEMQNSTQALIKAYEKIHSLESCEFSQEQMDIIELHVKKLLKLYCGTTLLNMLTHGYNLMHERVLIPISKNKLMDKAEPVQLDELKNTFRRLIIVPALENIENDFNNFSVQAALTRPDTKDLVSIAHAQFMGASQLSKDAIRRVLDTTSTILKRKEKEDNVSQTHVKNSIVDQNKKRETYVHPNARANKWQRPTPRASAPATSSSCWRSWSPSGRTSWGRSSTTWPATRRGGASTSTPGTKVNANSWKRIAPSAKPFSCTRTKRRPHPQPWSAPTCRRAGTGTHTWARGWAAGSARSGRTRRSWTAASPARG